MKAKLVFEGKEIEVEISDDDIKALKGEMPKKKTGYERVEPFETYFLQTYNGKVTDGIDDGDCFDDSLYATANYYSDKTVAENNARADRLYRQLRRFAVKHRKTEIDWRNIDQPKYFICHNSVQKKPGILYSTCRDFGQIYFNSKETAQLAIDTFKDELMWYFTEYKDSL